MLLLCLQVAQSSPRFDLDQERPAASLPATDGALPTSLAPSRHAASPVLAAARRPPSGAPASGASSFSAVAKQALRHQGNLSASTSASLGQSLAGGGSEPRHATHSVRSATPSGTGTQSPFRPAPFEQYHALFHSAQSRDSSVGNSPVLQPFGWGSAPPLMPALDLTGSDATGSRRPSGSSLVFPAAAASGALVEDRPATALTATQLLAMVLAPAGHRASLDPVWLAGLRRCSAHELNRSVYWELPPAPSESALRPDGKPARFGIALDYDTAHDSLYAFLCPRPMGRRAPLLHYGTRRRSLACCGLVC